MIDLILWVWGGCIVATIVIGFFELRYARGEVSREEFESHVDNTLRAQYARLSRSIEQDTKVIERLRSFGLSALDKDRPDPLGR